MATKFDNQIVTVNSYDPADGKNVAKKDRPKGYWRVQNRPFTGQVVWSKWSEFTDRNGKNHRVCRLGIANPDSPDNPRGVLIWSDSWQIESDDKPKAAKAPAPAKTVRVAKQDNGLDQKLDQMLGLLKSFDERIAKLEAEKVAS